METTFSIKTVLFDWDGTLLDSSALGFVAFQKTFKDLDIEFTREIYEKIYSPNWYTMYDALGLPSGKWPVADDLWLRHYGEEAPCLVPRSRETVLALCRKGYRMGLVSSGSCSRVRRELETVGFDFIFEAVVCNEETVEKKPHPEGLQRAAVAMNADLEDCCYVGDSPEDIEMGKRAGILTVGINGGYPGSRRLADANPDIYLDSIPQLLQHF